MDFVGGNLRFKLRGAPRAGTLKTTPLKKKNELTIRACRQRKAKWLIAKDPLKLGANCSEVEETTTTTEEDQDGEGENMLTQPRQA